MVSAETRAKIAATLRARKVSDEERQRQLANLAKGRTPEAQASRRGKPLAPEHRAKIGKSLKKQDPECSVEDCTSPPAARGWCPKHYWRWRQHGDPLVEFSKPTGVDSPNWKGDEATSAAMHYRAKRCLPMECALADATCKGRLEASFRRHDTPPEAWLDDPKGPYSVNLDHYWRLCRSHHVRLDHGLLDL